MNGKVAVPATTTATTIKHAVCPILSCRSLWTNFGYLASSGERAGCARSVVKQWPDIDDRQPAGAARLYRLNRSGDWWTICPKCCGVGTSRSCSSRAVSANVASFSCCSGILHSLTLASEALHFGSNYTTKHKPRQNLSRKIGLELHHPHLHCDIETYHAIGYILEGVPDITLGWNRCSFSTL